jgi:hypothetical protein
VYHVRSQSSRASAGCCDPGCSPPPRLGSRRATGQGPCESPARRQSCQREGWTRHTTATGHRAPPPQSVDDGRDRIGDVFAVEGAPAGDHLVEHTAEGPDISALVDGFSLRLLRRHVGRGTKDDVAQRERGGTGDRRRSTNAPDGVTAVGPGFARPKSSTLTLPSLRTFTFAGFRSR